MRGHSTEVLRCLQYRTIRYQKTFRSLASCAFLANAVIMVSVLLITFKFGIHFVQIANIGAFCENIIFYLITIAILIYVRFNFRNLTLECQFQLKRVKTTFPRRRRGPAPELLLSQLISYVRGQFIVYIITFGNNL